MTEAFFCKMSRQMPRGIRAASKEELVERIELYLSEAIADPAPHRRGRGPDRMETRKFAWRRNMFTAVEKFVP